MKRTVRFLACALLFALLSCFAVVPVSYAENDEMGPAPSDWDWAKGYEDDGRLEIFPTHCVPEPSLYPMETSFHLI